MKSIENDDVLCEYLAKLAGEILLDIRKHSKLEGQALGNHADKTANDAIISELKQFRPKDAILSEESIDCENRNSSKRVWIIDPLDGTKEFIEGRDDWAVHIGLAISGIAKHGAVAIPQFGQMFSTLASEKDRTIPNKIELNGQPRAPILLISRSRAPKGVENLRDFLGAQMRNMGSAGYKAMQVVAGAADVYFHSGGQSEWDNCAPIAIAKAYGLYAGDIYGNEIVYNKSDVLVPNLLICKNEYLEPIKTWVKENNI